jgi:hypothetical protein
VGILLNITKIDLKESRVKFGPMDRILFSPIRLIESQIDTEIKSIADVNNWNMNNINQEIRWVDYFFEEFMKEPKTVPTWLRGTPTPLNKNHNHYYNVDEIVMNIIEYNSPINGVRVSIGNATNKTKAAAKQYIWEKLHRNLDFRTGDETIASLVLDLAEYGKVDPLKIVIKMSGEWSDYVRNIFSLWERGYRNLIFFIMKRYGHTVADFKVMIIDTRYDAKAHIREVPEIKGDANEVPWQD